jgi:anti-anti-sigma regulatory factor
MAPTTATFRVVLRGNLMVGNCEHTRHAVVEGLEAANALNIDCSDADEIDLSFLQILFAAQRDAERSNKRIALSAPPNGPLAEALERCGFAPAGARTSLSEVFSPLNRVCP